MFVIPPLVFSEAVRKFWATRDSQVLEQQRRGATDQGFRGAVTGGQQMNGFARKIVELMIAAGVQPGNIYSTRARGDLPGFFRPTKGWDLVVVIDGRLLAAIELKSQVGPSFGNNFNNRTEEAMGSAMDLWTAYREGAFRASPMPWLGYFLVVEDCPESRAPVAVREPHFPIFDEFRGTSYLKRYELFCLKLVRERQYSSACFLVADRQRAQLEASYEEPSGDLAANQFLSQLLRHVGSM